MITFKKFSGKLKKLHQSTFNKRYEETTTLASHIWKLKDKNDQYKIKWKIIKKVPERKSGDKKCKLCLMEILKILEYKKKHGDNCLNKRSEFNGGCRHKRKYKLRNWLTEEQLGDQRGENNT